MLRHFFCIKLNIFLYILLLGAQCKSSSSTSNLSDIETFLKSQTFDQTLVEAALRELSQAPHPLGSLRQAELATYLQSQLKSMGFQPIVQSFSAKVPNPILLENPDAPAPLALEKEGKNILATLDSNAPCTLLIGSHYDSKYFSAFSYVGANDSGSSSAALLWVIKVLKVWKEQSSKECTYTGVWFDGEEAYLTDWNDGLTRHPIKSQDNTYGSRHLAGSLESCQTGWCLPQTNMAVTGLVLLDMIGSPEILLTKDLNSTKHWINEALTLDEELGLNLYQRKTTNSNSVEDDHIPFLKKNLPAIDLIDFNNLEVWHQPGDDFDRVSMDSIKRASQLAIALAIQIEQGNL